MILFLSSIVFLQMLRRVSMLILYLYLLLLTMSLGAFLGFVEVFLVVFSQIVTDITQSPYSVFMTTLIKSNESWTDSMGTLG